MTSERYYTLSSAAARVAVDETEPRSRRLSWPFPKQLQHFEYINDLRLWFEAQPELGVEAFWAEWQFKDAGVRPAVVPDALVALEPTGRRLWLALEVDCGTENSNLVARKMLMYKCEVEGSLHGLLAVFIWVPGWRRLRAVVAACYRAGVVEAGVPCWLGDLDRLATMRADSADVVDLQALGDETQPPASSLATLLASPVGLSCREERHEPVTGSVSDDCRLGVPRAYGGTESCG